MTYLLDTNVVSELRRIDRADERVRQWAMRVPSTALYLSVITLFEIEVGILRVERRDPAQATILRRWLEENILVDFDTRILSVNVAVVRRCARLHVPDSRSDRDAMIAATAFVQGLTVVTRNTADFAATGVTLFNPWEDVR